MMRRQLQAARAGTIDKFFDLRKGWFRNADA
jgi:hypothetical protein